ncbi:MAG: hypothetical protein FJ280_01510 [Planctomycetes bacterium]|nr:hypothetical protein [Planctomycetota bacterium]
MKKHHDRLFQALAGLKREGASQTVPEEVVEETLRQMADRKEPRADSCPRLLPVRRHSSARRPLVRLAAAAAIFVLLGYLAGRLSAPKPQNPDQLRAALAPAVAAALEPALRERVVEDLRQEYQLALAAVYVRVKEELTAQYRDDLNRFALGTLAASNAVTNELLTQLVQELDTAKTQDLRRITRALYEIEMNRVQDKTQLASGLQTLASRTENELSRTRQEFAQLVLHARPQGFERPTTEPIPTHQERNKP